MAKPKNWDAMSEDERDAWRVKGRESQRKYREANCEKISEKSRKYREDNREKLAEYFRKYREANREKVVEYEREYREANRQELAEWQRKHYTKRRTQADADRFFQMMGAAEELTKIIKQRKDEQTEEMGNNE
jgi:hypothetical protein